MVDLQLVAELQFLVTPLTFYNNKPITVSDVFRSHRGPFGSYTSTNFSEFMPNLNVMESPRLVKEAEENSKKTGLELDQWIDELTALFWFTRDTCVMRPVDSCPQLRTCKETSWSSRSPDPKSDPRYIGGSLPIGADSVR